MDTMDSSIVRSMLWYALRRQMARMSPPHSV
jgi:hypothetical protein